MEISWEITTIYPEEMLEPQKIVTKSFTNGTIAGSVGKKIDRVVKPGINEDGILVATNNDIIISLIIDGHYHRDITKIMLDYFRDRIDSGKWNIDPSNFDTAFLESCLSFCHDIVEALLKQDALGEASFIISAVDLHTLVHYSFSVGDLMIFVHDPKREWGKNFQIGNRQFYQWINKFKIMGYQYHRLGLSPNSRMILLTDGLIDLPTIPLRKIDMLFEISPFEAKSYIQYALKSDLDDNVSVICLDFS